MKLTPNNLAEIMAFNLGTSAYSNNKLISQNPFEQVEELELFRAWNLGFRYEYVSELAEDTL